MQALVRTLIASTLMMALISAADVTLGSVTAVEDDRFTVSFHGDHGLMPDSVVHFYGPGSVEKNPLTGQVGVERRAFVGKGHVLSINGMTVTGHIFQRMDGATVSIGDDVVPVPGEDSPDAPPVLTAEIKPLTVAAQSTVTIRLPVQDPEGSSLSVVWGTRGERGMSGVLSARTTVQPEILFTAPAQAGQLDVLAVVSDAGGKSLDVIIPVTVGAVGAGDRGLVATAKNSGEQEPVKSVVRGPDGRWWSIDTDGAIQVASVGWAERSAMAIQEDADVDRALAIDPGEEDLVVLTGYEVAILGYDGVLRTRIVGLRGGTDLIRDSAGALFVADQSAGGVAVFEPNGQYRCRLGRPGEGSDAFEGLARIANDADDVLYALDSRTYTIHRYDSQHRRLEPWQIQGDRDIEAVDIAGHKSGLLLLLSDGQIRVFNEEGLATRAMQPLSAVGYFDRLYEPSSIVSDASGDIFVTYPQNDLVARYNAEGRLTGVRGASLWKANRFATDGRGYTYALNDSSGFISRFDAQGWLVGRFGGTDDDGPFEDPGSLAVAHDGSAVFAIDLDRTVVLRFDPSKPKAAPFVFGQRGSNPGQFEEPIALTVDAAGRVYVLDEEEKRVVVFDQSGRFLFNIEAQEMSRPRLVAVSGDGASVYIYDYSKYEIFKFKVDQGSKRASLVSQAGGRGREIGQYYGPIGMACDRQGMLYVADSRRGDVQVVDFGGTNAVTVHVSELSERYEFSSMTALALSPDGVALVANSRGTLTLTWR